MSSFLFDVTVPAGVQRDGVGRRCLLSLGNVIFSVTVPTDVQRQCRPALLSLGNLIFSTLKRDGPNWGCYVYTYILIYLVTACAVLSRLYLSCA